MAETVPAAAGDEASILKERARLLARPAQQADAGIELLEFRLATERYGIETTHVREICPLKSLTVLPGAPAFVRGIVSLRGYVLPVLDLKKFFELPDEGLTDLHRIIVVQGNDLHFGLLADMAVGMVSVQTGDLQTSLPTLTGIRSEYLKGVTADGLVVLALERLLHDPKIIVHEEIESV